MTLYRYIAGEIWPPFLASLFVAIFIMLAGRMIPITELMVTRGVSVREVARMVVYLLPDIVTFALPAVTLLAVLVAFLRLSGDSEIIALKSAGISPLQLLPPVLAFSLAAALAAGVLSVAASPWGNRAFKDLVFTLARSQADLAIKERVFCEPFDQVTFYVNRFSPQDGTMQDVLVADQRDSRVGATIVAQRARIVSDPIRRRIGVVFHKGTLFLVEKDLENARTLAFEDYTLTLDLTDVMAAVGGRKKKPYELSFGELRKRIQSLPKGDKTWNEAMRELQEKGAVPLAVLLMGLLGLPLGAQIRPRGRSAGIWVSLVIFALYYMCLAASRSLVSSGTLNPQVGVWFPDLLLALAFVLLLRAALRERPIPLPADLFLFLSKVPRGPRQGGRPARS